MKNQNNGEFKIEKEIPIPDFAFSRSKYPLKDMKIGDSFFVSSESLNGARSSCYNFSKIHKDYKFITRKENDGCRVWRVSVKI